MSDIVERLRDINIIRRDGLFNICDEAADEIERLRQQRDELLALLEEATSYTSCETWSPSLTYEINATIAKCKEE